MNPITNAKNLQKLTERELEMGIDIKNSWHNMYKDSAWVFVGGLHYDLSEGDIIAVFSQYGEIVNINLVRDKKTGKSKGFAFLCYEDQKSTILAVDNLNTIRLLDRIIRVDHVHEYKIPKEYSDMTDEMKELHNQGCAPQPLSIPEQYPADKTNYKTKRRRHSSNYSDDSSNRKKKGHKKHHKHKKSKKHKKEKHSS